MASPDEDSTLLDTPDEQPLQPEAQPANDTSVDAALDPEQAEPTETETPDLTPEQLDAEAVRDDEEQQLREDGNDDEERGEEESEPTGTNPADPTDHLVRQLSDATPAIVATLFPASSTADGTPAQAPTATQAAAAVSAKTPLTPAPGEEQSAASTKEEDQRLAETAAKIEVTPDEVAQFKQQNPAFAMWDDAKATQALKEITASALIESEHEQPGSSDAPQSSSVEPLPTSPTPVGLGSSIAIGKGGAVRIPSSALAQSRMADNPAVSVAAGVIKSGLEAYDAVNEIALGNPPNPGDFRKGFESYYDHLTGANSIAATLAQWTAGFVGVGKFAKLVGLAKAAEGVKGGTAALAIVKGAITDFTFFDGHQQRLSNLVNDNSVFGKSLANPITEALASDPSDTEAIGRLKNAAEGTGLGIVSDVLVHAVIALRAARAGDHAAANAAVDEAQKTFDSLNIPKAANDDIPLAAAKDDAIGTKPTAEAKASPDATATAETEGVAPPPQGEASSSSPATQPAGPSLDKFRLEAISKQIAGDLATDPLKRQLFTEFPADAPAPSTFDHLTDANDLRSILKATEDELLKGIDNSLTNANGRISIEESQRLSQEFATMTGTDEGVFLNRMASDAGSIQQLHARLLAYDQMTRVQAAGLRDIAKAVRDGTPGEFGTIEKLHEAFENRLASYAQIQDWLKGVRSETGRALNILKYSRMLGPQLHSIDGSAMSALRSGVSIQDLANAINAAGTDRGRLAKVADPTVYERSRDALVSLFIKNILSGPSTHVTNILGNTLAAMTHPASKIIGGAIRLDPELMAEGVKQYGYMLTESVNGVKLAAEAYKRGHAILDSTARKLSGTPAEALEASRIGLDPDSITGKLFNAGATLLDGVSARALEASDEFFKQTIYSSEVMSRSFTDGVNLGLKGDALKAYVKQQRDAAFMEMPDRGSRVANPDASPNAAASLDVARFSTFSQDVKPSGLASYVLTGTNKWPLFKFAVPFVRVVNNILSFSGAMTPGLQGLSRMYTDAIKRGGRDAAVAQGRLALGSALWTSALGLAAGGYITGSGPDDYKQELAQTGWKAHALRIGETYIPLDRMDPIGFPFNMAGEFYQRWQEGQHGDESATQVASAMALAFYHNIADRSFLKGYADLFDAIMDKDGGGLERFASNVAGSLLVPNLVRQVGTNNLDPYMHEAKGFIENIMRRVPGLSDNLAVRRMPWGEKMTLNPSLYSTDKDDPLLKEYARVLETGERGVPDPLPRMKSIPGDKSLDLAREVLPDGRNLYDAYGDLVQRPAPDAPPLREVLQHLIDSEDYKHFIDGPGTLNGTKLKAWRTIIGRYRAAAWRQVLQTYPQVRDKVYAKKMDIAGRARAAQQSIEMESYLSE